MHESSDTLPCLNCEGNALVTEVHGSGWRVICPDCKNKTRYFFVTENEAVDAWNGGPSHRKTLEKLRRQMSRHFCVGFC